MAAEWDPHWGDPTVDPLHPRPEPPVCRYPSCDCDGPEGPACGLPGYAEAMNAPMVPDLLGALRQSIEKARALRRRTDG